jgi:hypothetical protein
MPASDVEPPHLLEQECSLEEFEEMCRWWEAKVRMRLDLWKSREQGWARARARVERPLP